MIISALPLKNHWAGLGDTNLRKFCGNHFSSITLKYQVCLVCPPKLKLSHEATILQAGPQRKKSKGTSCTSACSSDLLKLRHFPVINSVSGEPGCLNFDIFTLCRHHTGRQKHVQLAFSEYQPSHAVGMQTQRTSRLLALHSLAQMDSSCQRPARAALIKHLSYSRYSMAHMGPAIKSTGGVQCSAACSAL